MIRDTGWNTWDFRRILSFSYLDRGRERLSVRVSFLDDLERRRILDFRWRDLVEAGPHATDGSYARIEVHAGFEAQFTIEAAARDKVLYLAVTPTRTSGKRPVVEFAEPGSAHARSRGDRLEAGNWAARAEGAADRNRIFVTVDHPHFVGGRGRRLAVTCTLDPAGGLPQDSIADVLEDARRAYAARCLGGEGVLAGAPEAMMRGIAWNTIHDFTGRGIASLVSRNWSMDWNAAVLFGWDTYFLATMAALEDPELAYRNVEASLRGMAPGGFVPNWRFSSGAVTHDRSHPPVGGPALLRIAATAPDRDRVQSLLPDLLRWHAWWNRARDRGRDGLLSWGSSPEPVYEFPELRQILRNEAICAAYESGLDNSPTFDGIPFDAEAGTLKADDVGLNALHTADAEALAHLAGRDPEAGRLDQERSHRCERIRNRLWDSSQNTFANRLWEGPFSRRIAPTSFYPLLCGAATPDQARALVTAQLKNPRAFHGDWMLPSIRRDDPAFRDQDYWRGRIWPPMNYLTATGLRRAGFHEEASDIAARGLEMFMRAWREESRIYENFSAHTGAGGDVQNADPFYAWGGLLVYTAIQEIFDVAADSSLVFGTRRREETGLRNLRILGDLWNIRSDAGGLMVLRGADTVIESTVPCRITGYAPGDAAGPIRIEAAAKGKVRLRGLRPDLEIGVDLKGEKRTVRVGGRGDVEIEV